MKYLAGLVVGVLVISSLWGHYITGGALLARMDRNPKNKSYAGVLHYMAKGYEVGGNFQKVLEINRRIVDRYRASPHAEEAHFGVALALEKLNRWGEALEAYQIFLEKYPDSKYAASVRNNIEIIKSR